MGATKTILEVYEEIYFEQKGQVEELLEIIKNRELQVQELNQRIKDLERNLHG